MKQAYLTQVVRSVLLIGMLIVSACSTTPVPGPPAARPAQDVRLLTPANLPDVSFSIIKTGEFESRGALLFQGGQWGDKRVGVHSAILVRHPQGILLFDTGLGDNIDRQFADNISFWRKPLLAYQKKSSVHAQLPPELTPERIFLSHLHWDHASGIEDFPRAEIWVSRAEYTAERDKHSPLALPGQINNPQLKWHFISFASPRYENFAESLDVFEDGTIVLVPLPGHTPGSTGMFVNLPSGKRFFFIGDASWALEGAQNTVPKYWLSSALFDHDKSVAQATLIGIHQLMERHPELVVVPAHDAKVQDSLGYYPQWVR